MHHKLVKADEPSMARVFCSVGVLVPGVVGSAWPGAQAAVELSALTPDTAAEPAWAKLTNLLFQWSQSISCQQNWIWEATCGSEVRKEVTVTFRVVLCIFQEYPAQPAWLKLAEDFSAQARQLCDDVDSPRSRNRLVCFDCNMQQFFFHVCLIHPAWLGRSIKRQESLKLFRDYQKLHIKWKENKPVSTAKKPLELGRGVLSRPGEMRILKMQFLKHLSSSFLRVSFS